MVVRILKRILAIIICLIIGVFIINIPQEEMFDNEATYKITRTTYNRHRNVIRKTQDTKRGSELNTEPGLGIILFSGLIIIIILIIVDIFHLYNEERKHKESEWENILNE